jgi:hypothetical protein
MKLKNFHPEIVREYLECDCGTKAHMAVAEYDVEIGMTLHYQHRNWKGFWKRVWTAFKYVFQLGWEHDMGWDCTSMDKDNCAKMQRILDMAYKNGYGTIWEGPSETDGSATTESVPPPLPPLMPSKL